MGNVKSLANKMEELAAFRRTPREYEKAELCVSLRHGCRNILWTITLLFKVFRLYGLTEITIGVVKREEGDCNVCNGHITVKECICRPDIEPYVSVLIIRHKRSHAVSVE